VIVCRSSVFAVLLIVGASAGCSEDGEGAAPIDRRVLDGVAPVSGDSMDSVRWINEQVFDLRRPAIERCLEARDESSLLPVVERDFEVVNTMRSSDFPEAERLLEEGLIPEQAAVGLQEDPSGAFRDCALDTPPDDARGSQIDALYQSLNQTWIRAVVQDRSTAPETQAQAAFGRCLEGGGVLLDPSPSNDGGAEGEVAAPGPTTESRYFAWVEEKVLSGDVAVPALDEARLFVECGQPLWSARSSRLEQQRVAFVEQFRPELTELSDLLVGQP